MEDNSFIGATFRKMNTGTSTIKIHSGGKMDVEYKMYQDKCDGYEYLFIRYAEMSRPAFKKIIKSKILAHRRSRINHANDVMTKNRQQANHNLFLEILKHNALNPFNQRYYSRERYRSSRLIMSAVKINITSYAITYEPSPYMAFEEILSIVLDAANSIDIRV